MKSILFAVALFAGSLAAEEVKEPKKTVEKAMDAGAKKVDDIRESMDAARSNRSRTPYTITGDYTPFEFWVGGKYGISFTFNKTPSSSFELEYMRGSLAIGKFGVDFGDITEQRIGAYWRYFGRKKTFNLVTGLYYNELESGLGSKYAAGVPGGHIDVLKLNTIGVMFAVGNRWQTSGGFTWGFDWFSIYKPLITTKEEATFIDRTSNADDRENLQDSLDFIKKIPTFGVVKLHVGYSW